MAQRRMLSKQITETDIFMDMPLSAQALYLHFIMNADDDGFIGNAKTILRMVGASNDDLKLLIAKQFILTFDDGITVIKDWRIHNYIQKDRYHRTMYKEHLEELEVNDNGAYIKEKPMYTDCIQDVSKMDTQVRLGKVRLGKDINNSSSSDEQPDFEQEFEVVWKEYPNKTGKKQAFNHYKAWRRKSVNNTNEYLLERLALYKQDLAINTWKRPMNGSTWFNGRFDDEYQTQQQSNAQRGSSYGGVEF
ncbi:hypothetical protein ACWM0J_01610 [Pediococcus acidilactici]|uniref:hypothetical protein n=1 Tax=Pediococcus acidilactici TaxID=1254 RepID=UPI0018AA292A|nr:hypothetical protein [Pediococcus acidilactici]